jgi:octaprenyl-diphosphate synthase
MDSTSAASPVNLADSAPARRRSESTTPLARAPQSTMTACDDSAQHSLLRLYGPIREPLVAVEQLLGRELQSRYELLAPLLCHGTQLGGKRLRPAMLLLAAKAFGGITPEHIVMATVIEMVHTATLVHDDVLDQARTRRHVPTINARWDEHTSILLGDYLFAQSFRLAATLPSTEACQWIGEAARSVCEGELRQVLERDSLEMDEPTYIEIIEGKTAALCRVACQLGARFASAAPADVEALGEFGRCLGIAFQIADDYLDLWGDDQTVGKTLGTDIAQGKVTLPIIRMLACASRPDRERMIQILRGPAGRRLERIRPFLDRCDSQGYTRQVAQRYRGDAVDALHGVTDGPARTALLEIAEFCVDRNF